MNKQNAMNKLCIITYGRTGSTVAIRVGQENFIRTQSPHEQQRRIFAVGEIFRPDYCNNGYDMFGENGILREHSKSIQPPTNSLETYLEQFLGIAEYYNSNVFICKIVIHDQSFLDNLNQYISIMKNFKFVFLTRNLFDVNRSHKKAEVAKQWSDVDTTNISVKLKLQELYDLSNWTNDCLSVCSKIVNKLLIIDYKELFYNNKINVEAYNRMLNYSFNNNIKYIMHNDVTEIPGKQDRSIIDFNSVY